MSENWQVMGKGKHNFVPNSRKCDRCRTAYATSEIITTTFRGWYCAPCASFVWDRHQEQLTASA